MKKIRDERKARGLCVDCGTQLDSGRYRCKPCGEMHNIKKNKVKA